MLARSTRCAKSRAARRGFFVNDLNGPLYILDKATKKLTTYLDFNGREGHHGSFHRVRFEAGYGNGLVSLQFDPDYRRNGKFYTVHIEDPALTGFDRAGQRARSRAEPFAATRRQRPITTPGDDLSAKAC